MGRLRNGVGVGISNIPTLSSRRPFSPLSLFADGSQGVWFDDSNTDSMFQLSNGTGAVGLEDPIGKQLDLSGNNNHRIQASAPLRPTLSARYNLLLATATLATQSITTVATSYTIYFTGSGSVTLAGTYIGSFTAGTNTFTATAGTLVVTVTGSVLTADIRPTNQTVMLPVYQEVTSSTVYDTVGFPKYIKYSGSNQALSTASIDFTATAQMNTFMGLRKFNTASGFIVEMGASSITTNGTFSISTGNINTGTTYAGYSVTSRGTASTYYNSQAAFTSPITNTLNQRLDLTQTTLFAANGLYVNGTAVTPQTSTFTASTGNFSNNKIYFGGRAGLSIFFNGQEYQTIIVGKTLTATEIANTETYVNSKTLAY